MLPTRRLPPMHALAAFEAVARLENFSKAAEELCVTQSAISHRIRQLEEHLGCQLFVRVHKQVLLTAPGQRFLGVVRDAMQRLASGASEIAGHPAAKLRVTSAPALASQILIPHLKEFLAAADRIDLEIDTSTRMVDMTEEGFDLALRLGVGGWNGYESELLLEERIVPYSSPEYAARFGAQRTVAALERATLIHTKPFSWTQWFKRLSRPYGVNVKSGLSFEEVWAGIDAAVHGLGVVLSNEVSVLDARRKSLLVPFVDESVNLQRHYYGVYRADSPRLALIRQFLDWLKPTISAEVGRPPVSPASVPLA